MPRLGRARPGRNLVDRTCDLPRRDHQRRYCPLTTIAYQFDGRPTYAREGTNFVAGAAVQWLRDGLRIIERADVAGTMAAAAGPDQDVILVPAFVGLGAPYWD